jgi:hypothetical protein
LLPNSFLGFKLLKFEMLIFFCNFKTKNKTPKPQ